MSSDSEDDFYDNVTERLQKEKEKFQEDKTEATNTFDDSTELDEIIKNCKLPPKTKRKSVAKTSKKTAGGRCVALGSSVSNLPDVTVDNSENTTVGRRTRSKSKINSLPLPDIELPPTRSKRQKSNSNANDTSTESPGTSRGRGRGRRGRGRGRRGKRGWFWAESHDAVSEFLEAMMGSNSNQRNTCDPSIPTYSVGNTSEYPDQSHEQPLFSNSNQKKDDVVVIEDENIDDDNEELSVKVYWQNAEFFKFTIRRFQKIHQIFDYFTKKENVTQDKLLFTYNERILKPDDTPEAIEYSIVKFIDGGIVTQGVTDLLKKDGEKIKGGIKIKFQVQNLKKPFEITIRPDDKLSYAMMQCSEHLEKPLDKLKFEFDGDSISGKLTPRELEFEGGECIDVRILS